MIPTNHISANQDIAKIIDTPWVKSSQLKKLIQPMKDDRYLPYQISGKYEDGGIFYKGSYIPYPTNVEHYKYYWGMNEEWYTKRSDLYKSIGFEEVWHQVFKDSVGTDIHQAIWFLYKKRLFSKSCG